MDIRWTDYYVELEPEKRRELLQVLLGEVPDDGANAYRAELFKRRYVDPKKPDQLVDRMLWQCVNFGEIYKVRYLFKGSAVKEVKNALQELGFMEAGPAGGACEDALYWEIRNAASRYFKTCRNPEYRKVLFGLLASGSRDKKRQMCMDVWKMTAGLSGKYALEKELAVWNRAVTDQYFKEEPEGRAMLEKAASEMQS